jgi:hypothetical protein
LFAAVRNGPREPFGRYRLKGAATRGMPGYRSRRLIVAELDASDEYLRAGSEARIVNVLPAVVSPPAMG